jgi:hypothetical protein
LRSAARTLLAGLVLLVALNILYFLAILAVDAAVPPASLQRRIAAFSAAGQIGADYSLSPTGQTTDWFSDCIALSLNVYGGPGRSPLAQFRDSDVVLGEFTDQPHPCPALAQAPATGAAVEKLQYYVRYWHGYQLLTKPLTLLLNLPRIRGLLASVYVLVIVAFFIVTGPGRRRLPDAMLLALAFILLTDAATPLNPMVHTIALLSVFAGGILVHRVALHRDLRAVFLASVAAASVAGFVDLIYVPPLSAMVLAFAAVSGLAQSGAARWPTLARAVAAVLLAWAIGYLGTMALRVVASALVLPDPMTGARDFVAALAYRLNGDVAIVPHPAFMQAFRMNFTALRASPFVTPVGILAFLLVVFRLARGWRPRRSAISAACVGIALIPLPWYEVFRNHSELHFWFTYRWLAFSACLLILAALFALARPGGDRTAA